MVSLADIQINRGYEPDGSADEDLSYLSMESLFTPPGIGQEERRMQVRAYNHWLAMAANGELPAVEELRPEDIADFGPNGVLVDLTLGASRPAIVYLGERLAEECGNDREIFALGDVPERSLLSRLTEHCLEVVATRSPVGYDAEFEGRAGKTICYRSILLPFSSDGSSVDFVFGVIGWKDRAEPARQQQPSPVEQVSSPAPIAATPSLGELLTEARQAVGHALARDARSRDALYHAISVTYDLLLAAADDPAGFAIMAAKTAQRDPVRAAVLLVFGSHHDKTRHAEIVSLVAGAQRNALPRGGLYLRLSAAGGIKALLAEERQPRSGTAHRALPKPLARSLRKIAPLGLDNSISDNREFGLIVARRGPNGMLELISDAGGDARMLERAAKRLLAG